MISKIFSREWLLTTFLVIVGAAVCVRLGIWQLDRLEQRRQFNAQFEEMRSAEPLNLNTAETDELTSMEWRKIKVTGEYDFENQVAIRNQYHNGEYGYHLVTPVLFNGKAILVDRGWIPADANSAPTDWRQYDESGPAVNVEGQIRLGYVKPAIGGVEDPVPVNGEKIFLWNNLNLEKISAQLPYPVLEVYLQPDVAVGDDIPPIPYQPVIEISEGSHMGYALQWFSFAAILFFGYPFYLRKQINT